MNNSNNNKNHDKDNSNSNNNNTSILNNNNNNKNKIIRVTTRSQNDIIKEFNKNYPSILDNYIDKDEYSKLIKNLNGYDGVLNKKAIISCSIILLIGIACCSLGGISNKLFNKNNDNDDNGGSTGDQPPGVIASQIIFFVIGSICLINSIIFLIFIYKVPFKNVKTIRKTLLKYNQKYISRKIEFSLELDKNDYYMKIIIPSTPVPYSQLKDRYTEKTSLLKQQKQNQQIQPSDDKFKKVLIFDPHSDDIEFEEDINNNNNNQYNSI